MKRREISIAIGIIFPMVLITTVLLYSFNYYNYNLEKTKALNGFIQSKENMATSLAQSLALPVRNADVKIIEKLIEKTYEDLNIYSVEVYPAGDNLQVLYKRRDNNWVADFAKRDFAIDDIVFTKDIIFSKEYLGKVSIRLTSYIVEKRLYDNFNKSIFDTLILNLSLIFSLSVLLWLIAIKPLKKLEQYALAVSSGKPYKDLIPNKYFHGEIKNLFSSFEKMVLNLDARYDELKKSEEAEQKWSSIFRYAEWGVVALAADESTIEILNHAFAKIHGYKDEELRNRNILDLFTSKYKHDFSERIRIAIEKGHHIFESINIRKDSSTFPAIIDITAVKDDENKISYYAINVQDITERKKSENLIKEQSRTLQETNSELEKLNKELLFSNELIIEREARLNSYFSNAPNAIFIIDEEGSFSDVNPAGCKLVNSSKEDILNMNVVDFLAPESKELKNITSESLKKKGFAFLEMVILQKDGGKIHTMINLNRLPDGKYIAFSINITERKQAEEALKKSESKYRLLFENMITGFALHQMIYDRNGKAIDYKFLEINPAFEKLTGYSIKDLLGKTLREVDSNPAQETIEIADLVATTGKPYAYQNYSSKSNKYFDNWVFSSEKGYFAVIFTDITEKKQHEIVLHETNKRLERALTELQETQNQVMQHERLRSLGQLASGIAHDINNSLMPILGYTDLLMLNKDVLNVAKKQLSSIKTASLDIRRTIERMREFYRPKITDMEYSKLSINNIISTSIEFTKHRWKDIAQSEGKVINIIFTPGKELPDIMGSDSEIREALANLIINASDAMPDGGDLKIKSYSNEGNLVVEIIDNGIGMDEDTLNHCMDPFFTTKKDKGTGLGLSMVYGIVQRHKGQIKIESEKSKGTQIKLIFPPNKQTIIEQNEFLGKKVFGLNILCIDDDTEVRNIVLSMLESINHKVTSVDSGKEGLNLFYKNINTTDKYDLVITDLGMPFMDGKSVAESIKKISPSTPVILMTGWGSFIEAGSIKSIDYILRKPVSVIEIEKSLEFVMKTKSD